MFLCTSSHCAVISFHISSDLQLMNSVEIIENNSLGSPLPFWASTNHLCPCYRQRSLLPPFESAEVRALAKSLCRQIKTLLALWIMKLSFFPMDAICLTSSTCLTSDKSLVFTYLLINWFAGTSFVEVQMLNGKA